MQTNLNNTDKNGSPEPESPKKSGPFSTITNSVKNLISSGKAKTKEIYKESLEIQEARKKIRRQKELAPMAKSAPGNIIGPTVLVLGLILLACCVGFAAVSYFIYHSKLSFIALVYTLPLLFSIYMIFIGAKQNRHAEYYARYKTVFGEKPYASVQDLADSTKQTRYKTIKNIKSYELEGLYPEGRFSEDKEYYVLSEGGMAVLEEDLEIKKAKEEEIAQQEYFKNEYPQLYAITNQIDEAVDEISHLRTKEGALQKPQLNDELVDMENLLMQIKKFIQQEPDQIPNLKNFLDYFLPTVTKLLDTYCELDSEPLQTKNVIQTKEEIESVLRSINKAFENMYDDFYTGTAVDVYSDITVLKTMIQKQGLADSDFK